MAIDPTVPLWPELLRPARIARRRNHPVNFGPEVISGPPQSISADAGRLGFGLLQVPLVDDARLLTFRAIITDITSPLLPVYIPVFEDRRTPRYRAAVALPPGVPFSDGTIFSDGTTFLDQPVDFVAAAPAAARSMSITLTRQGPTGVELTAGNIIGIAERSYFVKRIFPSADNVAGHFDLAIWPYLRAAVAAGDAIWTEYPVCKCTVAPKSVEAAEELDNMDHGFVDIDFVESRW